VSVKGIDGKYHAAVKNSRGHSNAMFPFETLRRGVEYNAPRAEKRMLVAVSRELISAASLKTSGDQSYVPTLCRSRVARLF